jgi:predicted GIY-YIG superfamily endonuclease
MSKMHPTFASACASLHSKFEQLICKAPATIENVSDTPKGGVYLFSEDDKHLYVGRTKRIISKRLKNHVGTAKDCPFAFRLAREVTGNTLARYSGENTRKKLLANPDFLEAYEAAKGRIRRMGVRWVDEADPVKQALLEVYVAVVLKTPYNDFDTH